MKICVQNAIDICIETIQSLQLNDEKLMPVNHRFSKVYIA